MMFIRLDAGIIGTAAESDFFYLGYEFAADLFSDRKFVLAFERFVHPDF